MSREEREAFERELAGMRRTIREIQALALRLDNAAENALQLLKDSAPNNEGVATP